MESQEDKRLTVRLPEETFLKIKVQSIKEDKSMNTVINEILSKALEGVDLTI